MEPTTEILRDRESFLQRPILPTSIPPDWTIFWPTPWSNVPVPMRDRVVIAGAIEIAVPVSD